MFDDIKEVVAPNTLSACPGFKKIDIHGDASAFWSCSTYL